MDFDGAKDGDIAIVNGGAAKKTFKFDRVYMPTDNQGISNYAGVSIGPLCPLQFLCFFRHERSKW